MNKNHRVEFVTCLPAGVDWALVKEADDRFALFLAEGADLAPALENAWVAFCQQTVRPDVPVPRPRHRGRMALALVAATTVPVWPVAGALVRRGVRA